ncbi:unnamed protein product [Rhizoctonia solani]|uniref:Protein kinase domain-containing protein n=1 Tax=Rhizoctonia solani TaxID=456999 RepID=A0A8H3E408_9AGAM|nr:unnamed protein product [Rhizoctonia solani]
MIPEATLAFSAVSRRPTGGKAKLLIRGSRFGASTTPLDLSQGFLLNNPATRYLQTRTGRDLFGIHVLDPYNYDLGASHEHKLYPENFTAPVIGRVERQLRGIRRAQSLPNLPKKNSLLEYVERPAQLWDAMFDTVKPIDYNATILRLGGTFAKVVRSTYSNIRDFRQALQSATIGLRGSINLYRALGNDSQTVGTSSFQRHWNHFGPLVDEPENIEPCTIGSKMTIAEIIPILSRHCCKNLSRLLSLRSCSSHPISTGGFGDIYLGKLENGTPVAVKVARYSTDHANFRKQYKHTAKELRTWAKCQHPNVLPLLGMVEFRDQIAMVSPWMKNGDLRNYLRQHPEVDRCQLCYDICDGLVYLHSTNIVHGDLKGANVLISESGKAMLSDFGNSLVEDNTLIFTATTRDAACSSRWAAPEILEGAATSYPADVFALGMTMLVNIVPFRVYLSNNTLT